jgi:hypothetical protein
MSLSYEVESRVKTVRLHWAQRAGCWSPVACSEKNMTPKTR